MCRRSRRQDGAGRRADRIGPRRSSTTKMSRYGTLIAWAKTLGRDDCARVLPETLAEEKAADEKLTSIAESGVNRRAASKEASDEASKVERAGPSAALPFESERLRSRRFRPARGSSRSDLSENRTICPCSVQPGEQISMIWRRAPRDAKRHRIFAGHRLGAHQRAQPPGVDEGHADVRRVHRLGRIGAGDGVERGLRSRVGPQIGAQLGLARHARGDERDPTRGERRSKGSSERMQRQFAVTLTAMTWSHSFGSTWCRGRGRQERRRCRQGRRACPSGDKALRRAGRSRRSPGESIGASVAGASTSGRRARISSSSSSSAPCVRASATTCAPERAKASATARPIPREAPVTSATRAGGSRAGAVKSTLLLLLARIDGGR